MKGRASREKQARGWARYDDVVLVLRPYSRARTENGGYATTAGAPRPPQAWGVAMASNLVSHPQDTRTPTEDGTVHTMSITLIGPVGALVAVDDRFMYRNVAMRVSSVRLAPDGVYAEAVEYGG